MFFFPNSLFLSVFPGSFLLTLCFIWQFDGKFLAWQWSKKAIFLSPCLQESLFCSLLQEKDPLHPDQLLTTIFIILINMAFKTPFTDILFSHWFLVCFIISTSWTRSTFTWRMQCRGALRVFTLSMNSVGAFVFIPYTYIFYKYFGALMHSKRSFVSHNVSTETNDVWN